MRRVAVVFVAVVAVLFGVLHGGTGTARAATTQYVPGQFIAKIYTEGLGRMPDAAGWKGQVAFFVAHGCTKDTLTTVGSSIYTSGEFQNLGYGNAARLLALYRGALNHEPPPDGFAHWSQELASGTSWASVVRQFFASNDFRLLVPQICSGVVDSGSGSSYHFGTQPAMALPTGGTGFTGTQAQLQAKLDATPKGGTVTLASRALVTLTSPLTVPAGVTLTTAGGPDPRHYADMGRLVRATAFDDQLVKVMGGATLRDVWVDGHRGTPQNQGPLRHTVVTYGGTGTVVQDSRITDSAGPTSLYLFGHFNGYDCAKEKVTGNLITAYASDHYQNATWTDGVSIDCEDVDVANNAVVDASDVGIVVYRNTTDVAENAKVHDNTVLSAGNSTYGGLVLDPLYEPHGGPAQRFSFAGSSFTRNHIWTSRNTHFDMGISLGTRAWFAGHQGLTADSGTGGTVTGNDTNGVGAVVRTGLGVSGMFDTTVSGNDLSFDTRAPGRCPKLPYAASLSARTASGSISPRPADVAYDGCIGH